MRKIIVISGLCLVSLITLLFYGCGGGVGSYGGGGGSSSSGIATNITITPNVATVTVSSMATFKAVSKDGNGNTLTGVPLVWNSSNTAVATVDNNGVATGVALGTAEITASVTYTSSGGYTTGTGTTYTSNMAKLTVATTIDAMGIVATGHALVGALVTLKDAQGRSQTALSDAHGRFQISTAGLQAPFLLKADDGRGHPMFGATAAAGGANIDTVTDVMLRAWYAAHGTTPEQAFADMAAHPAPDAKSLQALDHAFNGVLKDAMTSQGVDPDKFNLFSTAFNADSTGFDAVLDNTHVATSGKLELQDGLMGRSTDVSGLGR